MNLVDRVRRRAGFTLIELLVVIVVAGVLLTLAAPSFNDLIKVQRLKSVAAQAVTDLQFARAEAASRGVPVNVRVQGAPSGGTKSCYILFTDTAASPSNRCDCQQPAGSRCTAAGTQEIRTVTVLTADSVQLTPIGTSYFSYDPVSGGITATPSDSGLPVAQAFSLRAAIDTPRSLVVQVSTTGRPLTCAPSGSSMQVPAC